jgi:hypothetical protein
LPQVGIRGTDNNNYIAFSNAFTSWFTYQIGNNSGVKMTFNSANLIPNGLIYTITAPPNCMAPTAPLQGLSISSLYPLMVTNIVNPINSGNYFIVLATPNGAQPTALPVNNVVYQEGNALGNSIVIGVSNQTNIVSQGLQPNILYKITAIGGNFNTCSGGPMYLTNNLVSDTITFIGPKKYYWNATSGSADFQNPSSWSPPRLNAFDTDSLFFNNGGNSMATNYSFIPSIPFIFVENNTAITVSCTNTLQNFSLINPLYIAQGSVFGLKNIIFQSFLTMGSISKVYGNFLLDSNSSISLANNTTNQLEIFGKLMMNDSTGSIASGSINNITIKNGGTYQHNVNGGSIPNIKYDSTSAILVTGVKNTTPLFPANINIGNFVWNCANQSSVINLGSGGFADTLLGSFTVLGTNGYYFNLGYDQVSIFGNLIQNNNSLFKLSSSTTSKMIVYGNVQLNSGTLEFTPASNQSISLVLVGNFLQNVGHTLTSTTNLGFGLYFFGNSLQNFDLNGTVTTCPMNFSINNLCHQWLFQSYLFWQFYRKWYYKI